QPGSNSSGRRPRPSDVTSVLEKPTSRSSTRCRPGPRREAARGEQIGGSAMTTTDDLTTRTAGGGRAAVEQHAPASAVVLDRLERTTWEALDADLLELTARVVASVHEYPPLQRPRDLGASAYAERDVSRWSTFDDLDDA